MRLTRFVLTSMATVVAAVLMAVVPAGATAATATVTGDRTTVAIPPSTAGVLIGNGILLLPVGGAVEVPTFNGGIGVKASFRVTGGSLICSPEPKASIDGATRRVVVSNVGVALDAGAVAALNHALGTTVFSGGLTIGSATSSLRLR